MAANEWILSIYEQINECWITLSDITRIILYINFDAISKLSKKNFNKKRKKDSINYCFKSFNDGNKFESKWINEILSNPINYLMNEWIYVCVMNKLIA